MKKLISVGAVLLTSFMATSSFATPPTNHGALVGVWTNTNSATRSIVRLVIRNAAGGGITVQPFGACSPTPCNHGIAAADAFAPGVSSMKSIGFNTMRDFGFKKTSYNGFLRGRLLTLLTQDMFAAGDTRFNYTVMENFRKIGRALPLDASDVGPLETLEHVFDRTSDHATNADLE